VARLAVLASGNGSNFEALTLAARGAGHETALLVCDTPGAPVLERAARLGVPSLLAPYAGRRRAEAEEEIRAALDGCGADIVALAGYLRLLGPAFVRHYAGRLVNIHPSLLPAWPGLDAIRRAYEAGEAELGVSVHFVDEGMDTGQLIAQCRVPRLESLAATEEAIHRAEHELYARALLGLLGGALGSADA
jgi:phosphoribosylglycinamide formyltransferase-1